MNKFSFLLNPDVNSNVEISKSEIKTNIELCPKCKQQLAEEGYCSYSEELDDEPGMCMCCSSCRSNCALDI